MEKEVGNYKENAISSSLDSVETTIGDLILSITEISGNYGKSEEESYKIAQKTLTDVLSKQDVEYNLEDFEL